MSEPKKIECQRCGNLADTMAELRAACPSYLIAGECQEPALVTHQHVIPPPPQDTLS